MTHQVRKGYRNHRRATWGLAIVLVVAIAAVVIPIATGASDKTFTLTVSPNPVCSSTTDGDASTTVKLTNTARTQTLGSVQIYFPPNSIHTTSRGTLLANSTSSFFTGRRDIVAIDDLNLSKGSVLSLAVSFKSGTFTGEVSATAKQSNKFNDTQGGANLFELDPSQGAWPRLDVVACVTVQGRVYVDRNQDGFYSTNGSNSDIGVISDFPKAWSVELFRKESGSYPATPFRTATSSATDGMYTLAQVPVGGDYKVCVTALGTDASSAWALRVPVGNTQCGALSSSSDSSSAANLLSELSGPGPVTGQDFGAVPVTGPFGASDTSTVGGYSVTGASNTTKADQRYVQETWVDENGRTNFRFAPVFPCSPPQDCTKKIYLLESLKADVALTTLAGDQARLFYDDDPSFYEVQLEVMPYCLVDPRAGQPSGSLATSGVLPSGATSCIVTGSQAVTPGGKVHVEFLVYSSFDGQRQTG
jgi:hypothetical protein